MKKLNLILLLLFPALGLVKSACAHTQITKPPMGWNSFDSYGVYLHHDAAIRNMEEQAKRYKQFGYEYFVIDAGWFGEFKQIPGTIFPAEKHAADVRINEFGLLQPSKTYFPHGLKVLADRAHSLGLKFGVHIMRGIPRKAVKLNTPIRGTNYTAQDIADPQSICTWNDQNFGVNMDKPGAQEFYNSLINQFAEWGVDFIKADDIVPFPREVEAVARAIAQCGRPMVLSLSPGGNVDANAINSFKMANMLRVTHDIWDDQVGMDQCFKAWRKWAGAEKHDFYIDMDMIPFGELQIMSPAPTGITGKESRDELLKRKKKGELTNIELLSGKGWHRQSELTKDQHLSFITMRALAASPLMIGGDLVSMDDFSYTLLTNADIIACNQNGVMGRLKYENGQIETWAVNQKNASGRGWIGVFNRNINNPKQVTLSADVLGLAADSTTALHDIWADKKIQVGDAVVIPANGVLFLKFETK